MQHETVNIISPQMFQRTRDRLRHLNRKLGRRVVRQPMVLSALVSKFRLQKNIGARYYSRVISRSQPLPNSRLEIVPSLVCRIDSPEPARSASSTRAAVRSSFHAVP